ncbi:putative clathrin assembly protein At4g40080 [Pistacia vera]|uniref:putative clathrin assembly protein At4g40080 n=1 Tax=Pistacia vera TaxID=55513 RepID=UPI001262BC79|nr:putative clathrin assembly protein At4g40080 [Pistacia vera]
MGRLTNLIGTIKDKVSQSRVAMVSNPRTLSLHLAVLRATTHDPSSPPNQKHLTSLLDFGHSSRATASAVIETLMDRLQTTRDASVAIKCLITVHHIIKHGSFILQDQLSVYPSTGGRNYLKLSNFRDNSTPLTWELSSWVRWYALYLEHVLSTSRILGFFLGSISDKDINNEEKVSSLMNNDLLREIDSSVGLLEEMCKRPDFLHMHGNKLVEEVMGLVEEDYLSAINEVSIRLSEFRERLSSLSLGDSVELVCAMKRLEICKERLEVLSNRKRVMIETFWGMVNQLKDVVGKENKYREERSVTVRRDKVSESARFGDRVMKYGGHSVRFSSGRFELNKFPVLVLDSVQSCA